MSQRTLPFRILVWDREQSAGGAPNERLITHRLRPYFAEMAKFKSLSKLIKSPLWRQIGPRVLECLGGVEFGFYGEMAPPPRRRFLRAVYFNLNGEPSYEALLETLKSHPVLGSADLYYFVNTDIGVARSGNINLLRSLALELSCHYLFVPTHILLDPLKAPDNHLGLTGLGILSRFPLEEFQVYPMQSFRDPMRGDNRCLGANKAVYAKIKLPDMGVLNVLLFTLDSVSSPRGRLRQMKSVLKHYEKLPDDIPLLVAGDWQTTGYNTRTAGRLFAGFLNRIARGFEGIVEEHHAHPERYFERHVFNYLDRIGLDYETVNQMGSPTWHCRFEDFEIKGAFSRKALDTVIRLIKKFFYHGTDKIALKTDWFAASPRILASEDPRAERPKVLPNHYCGGTVMTAHHPMVLDFEVR